LKQSDGSKVLAATSRLSSRIIDHLGRPVANTPGFDLPGWNVAEDERDYRISQTFKTEENGDFHIVGVMPGAYYLGANIWGLNHPKRSTLPQVLYPGTLECWNSRSSLCWRRRANQRPYFSSAGLW